MSATPTPPAPEPTPRTDALFNNYVAMSPQRARQLERELSASRAEAAELRVMLSEVSAACYGGVACECLPATHDEDGNVLAAVQCLPCRVRALLARTGKDGAK